MLGCAYLRVPTWAQFRLPFYFNGHNLLPTSSTARASTTVLDNAFVAIERRERAQVLATTIQSRPCTTSSSNWHARIACDRPVRSGVHGA